MQYRTIVRNSPNMNTDAVRSITSLSKRNSFALPALLCVIASGLIFFTGSVNGFEQCRDDSDCSGKNIYCLDGYCEGHCVPCQNLNREESASGCAKKRENCGACLKGTVAEDLTRGRKSDYCKTVGGVVNPSPSTTGPSVNWLPWTLTAICVVQISAMVVLYILKRRSTARTSNNPNQAGGPDEYYKTPPPTNPNWNPIPGHEETVNYDRSRPVIVPERIMAAEEESDDSADDMSPLNRPLHPHETLDNNGTPEGAYQEDKIELSEIHEGNFSFSVFVKPAGSTSISTNKTPQQRN